MIEKSSNAPHQSRTRKIFLANALANIYESPMIHYRSSKDANQGGRYKHFCFIREGLLVYVNGDCESTEGKRSKKSYLTLHTVFRLAFLGQSKSTPLPPIPYHLLLGGICVNLWCNMVYITYY